MPILRSFTLAENTRQLSNAAVDKALLDWEERVNEARDEGIALGLQQAADQVREAEAMQASVDAKITAIQQEADLKVKNKQAQWQEEWGRVLASLQEGLDEVASLEKQAVQSSERVLLQLALQMAGHMMQREIEVDEAWMLPLVQKSIQQLPDKRDIQIRLHPADAELLQERRSAVAESIQRSISFEVIGDEQLSRGSLILESKGTYIDSGLPKSWERLCEHMLQGAPRSDWATSAVAGPATDYEIQAAPATEADVVLRELTESKPEVSAEHMGNDQAVTDDAVSQLNQDIKGEQDAES